MAAYRPMDQVQIDVIDAEVLESGIETLLDALMVCVRELARDLPNGANLISGRSEIISKTYEYLRTGYTRLAYALSDVFLVIVQPGNGVTITPVGGTWGSGSPSTIEVSIPALQRMRNGVDNLLGFGLPGAYISTNPYTRKIRSSIDQRGGERAEKPTDPIQGQGSCSRRSR
jgi:hypothetical protein